MADLGMLLYLLTAFKGLGSGLFLYFLLYTPVYADPIMVQTQIFSHQYGSRRNKETARVSHEVMDR
jgi:hypothetical protein